MSGIVRAMVVNAVFGPGVALDAFNVAMRFPTVLRDLFAEGALSSAFTKALVEARAEGREREVTELVFTIFGIVTLGIGVLGAVFAEPLIDAVTAEGFGASHKIAVICFQVLIFYLPLAMISSVAMALLGVRGMTFRATLASLFFNVGSVFGALALAPLFHAVGWEPVVGLAVGTLLGGAFQFLYQAIPLFSAGFFRGFRLKIERNPIKEMLYLMFPRMIGQGAFTIALFVNTHFATSAGVGAISYITNAQNIILVPVGLFGVAGGFASLPLLTESVHQKDSERFWKTLASSSTSNIWMSAHSVICLSLLAVPLCQILLQHGKVRPEDTLMNALAVMAYCSSILFNSLNKILTQGFFALGDTRQIIINSFCYLAVNASLSALLAPRFGILGLGISNSVSALVDLILNIVFLPRRAKGKGVDDFWKHLGLWAPLPSLAILGTSVFCVAVSIIGFFPLWKSDWNVLLGSFWSGLALLGGGGVVITAIWMVALKAFGPEGLKLVFWGKIQRLKRKILG